MKSLNNCSNATTKTKMLLLILNSVTDGQAHRRA